MSTLTWPGWSHLPREARDTLFLLGVISWTIAPHFLHLPAWCLALTTGVVLWRAALALRNAPLPGRWPLFALLALALLLTAWTHRTLLGKDAGITLLVVLMVLKTLELRARRDALVVFFLGFFIVLTNFLYAQSLPVAAAMLVSVWGLLTALVLAHMPVGRPPIAHAGTVAAKAALLGAPIMLLLFMLFPRMAPLWSVPQDTVAKTGLSGQLRMGELAELAVDENIALRIRFDGPAPPVERLYFRGPVLSRFDGREWQRADELPARPSLELIGEPLAYEMTLEPQRLAMLPLLEATPDTPQAAPRIDGLRATQRADLQWQTHRPVTERVRFSARAWLDHRHGRERGAPSRADVALPAGYNPRTLAWAVSWARRPELATANPEAKLRAVLAHIGNAGFSYTLTPGTYGDDEGRHAIDEFWLDRREGFCEHFAAAFVVVMRALDIPARIVTGYQGADALPQDGWLVVRNSHAHAWAEVWLDGRGWTRVDPTAAVAPERVNLARSLRPPRGLVAGAFEAFNPALAQQLRSAWERLNNRWNQWVLNYSRNDQLDLLQRLGWRSPEWTDLAILLVGLLSGAALAGAGWAWWDRHRRDPWQRLAARIVRSLAALGVQAPAHEGTRAWARRVRQALGPRGDPLAARLERLDAQRHGRGAQARPDPAWWPGFRRAAAALRGDGSR